MNWISPLWITDMSAATSANDQAASVWMESLPTLIGVFVGTIVTVVVQWQITVLSLRRREYVALRLLLITLAQRRAFVSREANKADAAKDRERVTLSVLAARDHIAKTRESLRMNSSAWGVLDRMIQHCNEFLELMEEEREATHYRSLAARLRASLEPLVYDLAATWRPRRILGDAPMPTPIPGSLAYPPGSGLSNSEGTT